MAFQLYFWCFFLVAVKRLYSIHSRNQIHEGSEIGACFPLLCTKTQTTSMIRNLYAFAENENFMVSSHLNITKIL